MIRQLGELAVTLALCACWNGSSATPAPTAPATHPERFAFVPDEIANRLGSASVLVAAIDLSRAPPGLGRMLGGTAECASALANRGLLVIAFDLSAVSVVGYATGLPEPSARVCFEQLGDKLGGTTNTTPDGAIDVQVGDEEHGATFEIVSRDGTMMLRTLDTAPVSGPPSERLRELAASVPTDAFGFIVTTRFPDPEIETFAYWGRVVGDEVILNARAEGAKPGISGPYLQQVSGGMLLAASTARAMVPASAFHETVNEPTATMEAHIPLSWFTGSDLPRP